MSEYCPIRSDLLIPNLESLKGVHGYLAPTEIFARAVSDIQTIARTA